MTSATIATEIGDIEVDLFDESAPKATANFVKLAEQGFYDDVVFHRVIPGFVAQGGDGQFGKKSSLERGRVGTGGPGYKFEDEPVQGDYVRGSLAMANAGPKHQRLAVLHLPPGPDRQAAEGLHAVRPGDARHGRRGCHRGRSPGRQGPPERSRRDDVGDHPPRGRLRNLHPPSCQNPWKTAPGGVGYGGCSVSAAPAARSWVGRVRVVGAADVIDALDAWQKRPFRRTPSPGQLRGRFLREPASAFSGPVLGPENRLVAPGVRSPWRGHGRAEYRERAACSHARGQGARAGRLRRRGRRSARARLGVAPAEGGELVRILALAPGHRLHREALMEQLWPDRPLEAASNNLHQAIRVARAALGPTDDGGRQALVLRDGHGQPCPDRRRVGRRDRLRRCGP